MVSSEFSRESKETAAPATVLALQQQSLSLRTIVAPTEVNRTGNGTDGRYELKDAVIATGLSAAVVGLAILGARLRVVKPLISKGASGIEGSAAAAERAILDGRPLNTSMIGVFSEAPTSKLAAVSGADNVFGSPAVRAGLRTEGTDKSLALTKGEFLSNLDPQSLRNINGMQARLTTLRNADVKNLQPIDSVHHHVFTADLNSADGAVTRGVVHFPSVSHEDFAKRLRVEGALQELSPLLFNTIEPMASRYVSMNGLAYRAMVRHHVGDDFLKTVGAENNGVTSSVKSEELGPALSNLVERSPSSRKALEELLVERGVGGDTDLHEGQVRALMRLFPPSSKREIDRLINLDVEEGLELTRTPAWLKDPSAFYYPFSGRPLLPSTVDRLANFKAVLDNPEGRALMREARMTDHEIDSLFARNDWFIKNQKLPPMLSADAFYARYLPTRGGPGRVAQRPL